MANRRKIYTLFSFILILSSSSLRPSGERVTATQVEAGALEASLPADALGVILIENSARLKAGLQQTQFFRLASESATIDPTATSFRTAVDRLSGSGVRMGLVLMAPDDVRKQPSLAIIIEAPTSQAAKRGMEKVTAFYKSNPAGVDSGPSPVVKTTAQVDGEPISLARRGRLFIYGQDDAVAKMIKSQNGASSLSRDPDFQALRQAAPADQAVFAYLNFGRAVSYVAQRLLSQQQMKMDITALVVPMLQFAGVSTIRGIGLSTHYQNGQAKDDVQVVVSWNQGGILPALLALPPNQSRAAEVLPSATSGYVSFTLDANQIYDALLNTLAPLIIAQSGNSSVEGAVADLEQKLGFRIKQELLAALGREVVVAGINAKPQANKATSSTTVTLLAVKDAELLTKVVEKLQAQRTDTQSRSVETYQTHKIYPLLNNMSISLIGSFAVLGHPDQIRYVIDEAIEKKQVLASRENHRRVFGPETASESIRVFAGPQLLEHPRVIQALGGSNAQTSFVRSLQASVDPVIYGTGRRNETGIALQVTSPLGLVLGMDFFHASWKQEVGRLTAAKPGTGDSAQPPLLNLLSYFSRVFSSAQ